MRDFVKQQQEAASYDAWFQKQVQIGLDEANSGQLVTQEEVKSRFEAKRAGLLAKLAAQ